jgi:hypothetical protein
MKTIKVGDNNFPYGNKMYGKGGEYEVPDEVAKIFVREGRAKIIKNISEDPKQAFVDSSDEEFLAKVRRNASSIMQILEDHSRAEAEIRRQEFDADFKNDNVDNVEKSSSDTPSELGQSENGDVKDISSVTSEKTSDDKPKPAGEQGTDSAPPAGDTDEIPGHFPGREKLLAAGVTKLSEVPTTKEGLIKLGIPAKTADQIGSAQANK